MTTLLLSLLLAPASPLFEHAFQLDREAEAVALVTASCERCDWSARGREAALLSLSVDGVYSQHLVLTRGARGNYRVLLGALPKGAHRLALTLDTQRSARATGEVRVEGVGVETVAAGDRDHEALAHAPIIHTRKRSLERFSDVPLLAWVETHPGADGGRELRYSIVFSNEDGGTPSDRLMATWGRVTDIELVYAVELDAAGRVRRAEYQAKHHVMTAFAGRYQGRHPVLYVVTRNNMLSDRGPRTPRMALVPVGFSLDAVSREAVMDAHPWTYDVSAAELRREGRVLEGAVPGSKRIPDPRRFVYLEACGSVTDTRLSFELGLQGSDGSLSWYASDAGGPDFRVARSGCFRAAVALPRGASLDDVSRLRLRAHTRPPRKGETPLPRGTGSARIDRVNRLFGIGADDRPGPSLFSWTGGGELAPDGPALELPLRPR